MENMEYKERRPPRVRHLMYTCMCNIHTNIKESQLGLGIPCTRPHEHTEYILIILRNTHQEIDTHAHICMYNCTMPNSINTDNTENTYQAEDNSCSRTCKHIEYILVIWRITHSELDIS